MFGFKHIQYIFWYYHYFSSEHVLTVFCSLKNHLRWILITFTCEIHHLTERDSVKFSSHLTLISLFIDLVLKINYVKLTKKYVHNQSCASKKKNFFLSSLRLFYQIYRSIIGRTIFHLHRFDVYGKLPQNFSYRQHERSRNLKKKKKTMNTTKFGSYHNPELLFPNARILGKSPPPLLPKSSSFMLILCRCSRKQEKYKKYRRGEGGGL